MRIVNAFADAHINLVHLTKYFGEQMVLRDVSFAVQRGKVTTIIGKSGVGKSVLLKHIAGLLSPSSGKIFINNAELTGMKPYEQRQVLARLDYMFQNGALLDALTVFENVALPLEETTRFKPREVRLRVHQILEQLALAPSVWTKYPAQISGGMQKRVALARVLVREPEIVLFDEPTSGLDPVRRAAVFSMITQYQHQFGFTALLVSHDIPAVFSISDWVIVLSEQGICFNNAPGGLAEDHNPAVTELLSNGGHN